MEVLATAQKLKYPWIVRIIYCNPYFPFPEYNLARFAVALTFILWGGIILFPGNDTLNYYPLLALIMGKGVWGVFSILLGLFSFWRLAEFKAPTIFCSWINLFTASYWWAFCILLVFERSYIPIGLSGNIIVALLSTYVFLFQEMRVKYV